ncbi:chemotaxis protein CheW [Sanguibacter sp. A247]|uniref:chemotaxis protein CheW n=1 Tax=unclassified Sanguibacter TaxID=2645534 RepID=UPI003FD7028F
MTNQLVTFKIDDAMYGVPVGLVQETLGHQPRTLVPLAQRGVAGLVNLRGQVVLTVDLRPLLGLAPLAPGAEAMMVVVKVDGEAVSLLVDTVGEVLDVDEATFEPVPETVGSAMRSLVVGVHKLEGRLLLLLDVVAAVALQAGEERAS